MFQIMDKKSGIYCGRKIYTVYAVERITEYLTLFLIFDDGKFTWVDMDDFKPVL